MTCSKSSRQKSLELFPESVKFNKHTTMLVSMTCLFYSPCMHRTIFVSLASSFIVRQLNVSYNRRGKILEETPAVLLSSYYAPTSFLPANRAASYLLLIFFSMCSMYTVQDAHASWHENGRGWSRIRRQHEIVGLYQFSFTTVWLSLQIESNKHLEYTQGCHSPDFFKDSQLHRFDTHFCNGLLNIFPSIVLWI